MVISPITDVILWSNLFLVWRQGGAAARYSTSAAEKPAKQGNETSPLPHGMLALTDDGVPCSAKHLLVSVNMYSINVICPAGSAFRYEGNTFDMHRQKQ